MLYSERKVMIYRKLMIQLDTRCSVFSHRGIPLSVKVRSFISQILKVVSPLGEKLMLFSPLGFEIQKNNDYQTSKFELH